MIGLILKILPFKLVHLTRYLLVLASYYILKTCFTLAYLHDKKCCSKIFTRVRSERSKVVSLATLGLAASAPNMEVKCYALQKTPCDV